MGFFDTDTGIASHLKNESIFDRLSPAQVLVLGFAFLILIGAGLLSLPVSSVSGEPTGFLDALFTATSAVCVTGLVVVDTGTHFSLFGQIVIMVLIQVGGLGFMTMGTLFALIIGKKIHLKERLIIQESLNQLTMEGVVRLAKSVLAITFLIEGIAAVLLGLRFSQDYGLARGFYYGLFHSISAFNNAGFDLLGGFRSMTGYVTDSTINAVVTILVILGGLGFTVVVDLYTRRKWRRLSLHTKVVLSTALVLLVFGMAAFFLLEYHNAATLAPLSFKNKLTASWFQSVTPRTAGFNTLDIAGLTNATQFFFIILMFIGAAPGSTGGGIKTSTFATLISAVTALSRGKEDVELFERRLPKELVYRSLTIVLASLFLVITVTMLLTITEQADFLTLLFESTSAFATVGLSMGITTKLTVLGKLAITVTMFAGRLGPLTIAFAVAQRQRKTMYRLPEEKIMVG
ncbi:MAG: Trk family potassium uptake protein [Firmicutes bacterium HGW-Firmicutes-14]|nr:MAG: Trk family potassium uptake protein [Firmicutes bacterium HGW-Firmicutes-14]